MHWKTHVIGIVLVMLVLERAVSLVAYGAGVSVSSNGTLIIDNTPDPGKRAIVTNRRTVANGPKVFNPNSLPDWVQVMQRQDTTASGIKILMDAVGANNSISTSYENYGTSEQLTYFATTGHLFDLQSFRDAADWMRNNIASNASSHPTGTYGTISWSEFEDNVTNSRTMYGIVRIKVPLKPIGTGRNATDVNDACSTDSSKCTTIYGFCATSPATTAGLCSSAPSGNTDLKNGRISVRGALMFDFVDYSTGAPIPLANLPYFPRDIYFKVSVPINVNAAYNNANNYMGNMEYIDAITSGKVCVNLPCNITMSKQTDPIAFNKVPQEAKDAFQYQFGLALTSSIFNGLSQPNQYHLLMPSGYAQGWHDAFQELGITSAQWKTDLGFGAPDAVSADGILSVDEIRSDSFEDIPVYLYTGGLVDMHGHVNVSGLVYVPQAMELEQNVAGARQFIMGAIIVRDGFFVETKVKNGVAGITVIVSDPMSFSNIRTVANAAGSGFAAADEPGSTANGGNTGEPIVGNPSSTTIPGTGVAGAGGGTPGLKRWAEVRPR